jgi:uncharacterized protein
MNLSIRDAAPSTLIHNLQTLSAIVEKGRQHAEKEKWDASAVLATRLFPDMFPFSRQVQVVSDQCKGGIARLAGIDPPSFPDTESSFAELVQRLQTTIDFVRGVDAKRLDGAESRPVELKFPQSTLSFSNGWQYLNGFVLPNVYFHMSMAYAILRQCGVKVGKSDFIGKIA